MFFCSHGTGQSVHVVCGYISVCWIRDVISLFVNTWQPCKKLRMIPEPWMTKFLVPSVAKTPQNLDRNSKHTRQFLRKKLAFFLLKTSRWPCTRTEFEFFPLEGCIPCNQLQELAIIAHDAPGAESSTFRNEPHMFSLQNKVPSSTKVNSLEIMHREIPKHIVQWHIYGHGGTLLESPSPIDWVVTYTRSINKTSFSMSLSANSKSLLGECERK